MCLASKTPQFFNIIKSFDICFQNPCAMPIQRTNFIPLYMEIYINISQKNVNRPRLCACVCRERKKLKCTLFLALTIEIVPTGPKIHFPRQTFSCISSAYGYVVLKYLAFSQKKSRYLCLA